MTHPADADYSALNEPNEAVLDAMFAQAEKLASVLNGTGYAHTYPAISMREPEQGRRWAIPEPAIERHAMPVPLPPIADAIQREKAYSEAKVEQKKGGGVPINDEKRRTIEEHIATLERAANDIELMRLGSEIIDSAIATLRLATLGLVRASSPVGGVS